MPLALLRPNLAAGGQRQLRQALERTCLEAEHRRQTGHGSCMQQINLNFLMLHIQGIWLECACKQSSSHNPRRRQPASAQVPRILRLALAVRTTTDGRNLSGKHAPPRNNFRRRATRRLSNAPSWSHVAKHETAEHATPNNAAHGLRERLQGMLGGQLCR